MSTATARTRTRTTAGHRRRIPVLDAVVDALVIARRNILRYLRLPQLLLFSTLQPVMFLLLFNFVFGGAIGGTLPADVDYIQWLMPGLLIQVATFGAGQTAVGLAEDLSKGVVDRFRSLPMARSAVLAGRTTADLVRNAAVLSLMFSVGFAIGFRWETGPALFLAGFIVALLFGHAISWVMATIGLAVRNPEAAQSAVFLPVFPFVFASSIFLPTQTMPAWLRVFADHQPVTAVANALRGLMLGEHVLPAGQSVAGQTLVALAWIAGITMVASLLAVRLYRRVQS